ncbi:hypothetical protein TUM12370_26390 [Salmonella enterica subsp. enterica serovar Choleraesuis]|nr:hypothetical protein TUM12370_26390 [Salmonella enterica subsp. enterica serovar Choleraesuis]
MTTKKSNLSLKIMTLNIHKGFSAFNRRFILPALRDAVTRVSADIICLQEVQGAHSLHATRVSNWPQTSHYQFLADTGWSEYAYGRNAIYPEGHHGNAVLSRLPITAWQNHDISITGHENRGLLHCELHPPGFGVLHIICVHLGLHETHRKAQLLQLSEIINALPADQHVVVAGDFNDWRQRATSILSHHAGLKDAWATRKRPPRTFPVSFPLLRLDRIYVKNLNATPVALRRRDWSRLSDHAPLAVEVSL